MNTINLYAQPDIDPGADPTDWQDIIASRALRQAVEQDQLPVIPDRLRSAYDAQAQVEQLAEELRRDPASGDEQDVIDNAIADVLAGRPLPADLGTVLHDKTVESQRRHTANLAAEKLLTTMSQRIPQIITESLPEVLDGIRAEVEQALTGARAAVAILDGLDVGDGEAVAAATDEQRAAIADLREASRRYNRARKMQRDALVASDLRPSGTTNWTAGGHTWKSVFDRAVHELSTAGGTVELPTTMKWHQRITALAARTDVWVPTPEQMHQLWITRVQHVGPSSRVTVTASGSIINADHGSDDDAS